MIVFDNAAVVVADSTLCEGVVGLCDCIKTLASCFSTDALSDFEPRSVGAAASDVTDDERQTPHEVADRIVTQLLSNTRPKRDVINAIRECNAQAQSMRDPVQAIEHLLLLLDASQPATSARGVSAQLSTLDKLFASDDAAHLLTSSLQQTIHSRLELSRDLLLFLVFCTKSDKQVHLIRPFFPATKSFAARNRVLFIGGIEL